MSGFEDPSLAALRALAAGGDGAAVDRELGRLLAEEATPLLWRVIRSQLPDLPTGEQEEVHGDALLRLTVMLQRLRDGDPDLRVESFRAYVTATGVNGCRALLRSRHPERTRLQNQLRYALRHDAGLALWESDDGSPRCGLAAWRNRAEDRFASAPDPATRGAPFVAALASTPTGAEIPGLLRRYFLWKGRPVSFAELTSEMSAALGVRDLPLLSLSDPAAEDDGDEGGSAPEPVEGRPGADRELADRQFLERLWVEVRELPRPQRVALLLNLRDPQGRDRLRLFPLTGVASVAELARVLELGRAELESVWDQLPLEDRAIAERLGVTQRQVINLRKSARARLGRRLALFGRPPAATAAGERR